MPPQQTSQDQNPTPNQQPAPSAQPLPMQPLGSEPHSSGGSKLPIILAIISLFLFWLPAVGIIVAIVALIKAKQRPQSRKLIMGLATVAILANIGMIAVYIDVGSKPPASPTSTALDQAKQNDDKIMAGFETPENKFTFIDAGKFTRNNIRLIEVNNNDELYNKYASPGLKQTYNLIAFKVNMVGILGHLPVIPKFTDEKFSSSTAGGHQIMTVVDHVEEGDTSQEQFNKATYVKQTVELTASGWVLTGISGSDSPITP